MPPLWWGLFNRYPYMCPILLTALVAGAIEVQPGVMQVEYFPPAVDLVRGSYIETITMPTQEYLDCTDFTFLR